MSSCILEYENALEEFRKTFCSNNIHGWGVGLKFKSGKLTDKICLFVLVYKKLPPHLVPSTEFVPPVWRGLITDVCEIPQTHALSFTAPARPVPAGVSADHFKLGAATICLPVFRQDMTYLLGCTHSFAYYNAGQIGDFILQPGPTDGGFVPDFVVALLSEFIPILTPPAENIAEGAIAEIQPEDVSFFIQGWGSYNREIGDCELGKRVVKIGRSTGITYGRIASCSTIETIYFPSIGDCIFKDILRISNDGCPRLSLPGDSGSPVLRVDQNKPIGMVFAGNEYEYYAIKLTNIFSILSLTL
jgi:hypothetical protein